LEGVAVGDSVVVADAVADWDGLVVELGDLLGLGLCVPVPVGEQANFCACNDSAGQTGTAVHGLRVDVAQVSRMRRVPAARPQCAGRPKLAPLHLPPFPTHPAVLPAVAVFAMLRAVPRPDIGV